MANHTTLLEPRHPNLRAGATVNDVHDPVTVPVAPTVAEPLLREALGTTLVEIPRAGHMAAAEDPEPVARALADLWDRARTAAP